MIDKKAFKASMKVLDEHFRHHGKLNFKTAYKFYKDNLLTLADGMGELYFSLLSEYFTKIEDYDEMLKSNIITAEQCKEHKQRTLSHFQQSTAYNFIYKNSR